MGHSASTTPTRSEGIVDFVAGGKKFKTWYMIVGDLKNSKKRPVVLLHGGPGMNYVYMKPHEKLFFDAGIPLVFYNQIGYREYPDSPRELWTMNLFKNELDNLLNHLGIRDNFDLVGHSWGGVLGSDYAATRMHPGLKSLVLANTFCSSKLYREGVAYWIDRLPGNLPEIVKKHRAKGTNDSKEYKAAMQLYNNTHICTLSPWPEDLVASLTFSDGNHHPDFNTTKILREWNVVGDLHKVTCPTCLISSPTDEMWEPCVRPFFDNIPNCKWVEFQQSSHLPMYEEPTKYHEVLLDFLSHVEK